jgi:hypothetical protein
MEREHINGSDPVRTASGRVRQRYVHVGRTQLLIRKLRSLRELRTRTIVPIVGVAVLLPLVPTLLDSKQPAAAAPHQFLTGESLLTPSLRIVDSTIDGAERLAVPFRDSGTPVATYSPSALRSMGSAGSVGSADRNDKTTGMVWWITSNAAPNFDAAFVDQLRRGGTRVLLDGDTKLARELLGLETPKDAAARQPATSSVQRGVTVEWSPAVPTLMPTVRGQAISKTNRQTPALFLTEDARLMWAAPNLSGPDGPAALPFLAHELAQRWNVKPRAEVKGFDLFVDLDEETNRTPQWLVEKWSTAGVRRVFVAGWKYDTRTNDKYNYKPLITLAHKRNIEIWAWLEWPHVAFKFYDVYPECRERTADGRVAKIGWRENVALADPTCFDRAWETTEKMLKSAPFDGVNVADLHFESPYFGVRNPSNYTPFHPTVRTEFKEKFGWDPTEIARSETNAEKWKQWTTFREEKLFGIYEKLLPRLQKVKAGKQLAVTLMDDRSRTPESALVGENSGQSSARILKLRSVVPFEVIVRDPLPFRPTLPAEVAAGFGEAKAVLGVSAALRNVETDKGVRTKRPAGFELSRNISATRRTKSPIALFGTGRIRTDDLMSVKYALASDSRVVESNGVVYTSSTTPFRLILAKSARQILIDGKVSGAGTRIAVPAGRHRITVSAGGAVPGVATQTPEQLALDDSAADPTASEAAATTSEASSAPWLTAPILLVDTTVALGEPLAKRLRETGFEVRVIDTASEEKIRVDTKNASLVWFTNRAANELDPQLLADVLARKSPVILDGDSPVARTVLGLKPTGRVVSKFGFETIDVFLDTKVPTFSVTKPGVKTLAQVDANDPALVRVDNLLWSFVRLDEGINLERMPYLGQLIYQEFAVEPVAERRDWDLYLDPDLEKGSMEEFAERWVAAGVRRVYIAAWKDDRRTNSHYDYAKFVRIMHEANIEVMAWLEWPHVNFSFWEQHPECIEKTATGVDARIFWREHVALGVPGCFEKAWAETKLILDMAPFDGVNVAELYFEPAGEGPDRPEEYTPFNDTVLREFTKQYKYDARSLFDPKSPNYWKNDGPAFRAWNEYRGSLAVDYNRRLLRALKKIPAGKNLMITAIDDRYAPDGEEFHGFLSLGQNIGTNSYDLAKLRNDVPFEYQVEDPFTMWVAAADRYSTVGRLYPDVPKDQLVLDINVVNRPTAVQNGFSMEKAGGFELATSVASVTDSGARLALYASASTRPRDLPWIKYALAGGSTNIRRANETSSVVSVRSPAVVRLRVLRPVGAVTIDGKLTVMDSPVRYVDVPAGTHRVEFHEAT